MATRQAAAAQLQIMVNRVEEFTYVLGEEQWRALPEAQRWGYLRLECYVETALHELRHLRRAAGEKPHSQVLSRPREEASYTRAVTRRRPH